MQVRNIAAEIVSDLVFYRAYYESAWRPCWWFDEFPVIKRTKCGVWIKRDYDPKPRFVLNDSRKKFAYPTKEEAMTGYIKRTECYIKILRSNLERVTEQLAGAKGEPFAKPILLLPHLELGAIHGR